MSAKTVLSWLGQVVSWTVILGVVGVLAVAVVIPRLAGATPYTVLTGSMRPQYPVGTLVVIKPVSVDQLGIGDVATYQIDSGRPEVATHRIVGVGSTLDGNRTFTFQGDANNTPDPRPVLPVQVRGKLWYAVPYLGYVNNLLTGHQRQVAVWAVSGVLLGYAALMFAGSLRDRRRDRRRHPAGAGTVGTAAPTGRAPATAPAPATPLLVMGGGLVALLLTSGLIGLARGRSAT